MAESMVIEYNVVNIIPQSGHLPHLDSNEHSSNRKNK